MMDMPRRENTVDVGLGGMPTQTVDRRVPSDISRAPAVVENPNKPQAKRLLAEAKQEHLAGNLVEARKKVLEAQRLNVQFSADEERRLHLNQPSTERAARSAAAAVLSPAAWDACRQRQRGFHPQ